MKTIANILWFLFTGLGSCLAWFFVGLLWCLTVVGIPFGLQCFKLAGLYAWPFGKDVKGKFGKHPIANTLWLLFGGLGFAFSMAIAGLLWCITVVGIPFGLQCFKLAELALAPFGAKVD